jgi:protocatechuate 3,4-dioxygenase beta subunit
MFQCVSLSVGAAVALGFILEAGAAERLQSVVRRVSGPASTAVTNAVKTVHIAGTVVDVGGKPVAGAVIECYQHDTGRGRSHRTDMEVKQRVTTGTTGAFDFEVSAIPTVLIARKPGLAAAWSQYFNLTQDVSEERLVFTPPTTVPGLVVDEADKPVADAEVWVSYACILREQEEGRQSYAYLAGKAGRDCFSTRTAADGTFAIQGFPTNSTAELSVSKPGKVLREVQREYMSPETMTFQIGQHDVKLVVEPAGSVEGKVLVQEAKEPLAGMSIWLQPNRPGYFGGVDREPIMSGAEGKFRVPDLTAGAYELHATFGTNEVPEWVAETVAVTVESGQTAKDVQVLAVRGGFLEATVLGKLDHQPIGGVGVNASKQGYQGGNGSASNGVALLRLPPGEYKVSAYHKGNSHSEIHDLTVEAGRTNRLQIDLNPPPKIAGTVRDPSGAAAPAVRINVMPNWGNQGDEVKTDAKGHYEIAWDPQRYGGSDRSFCLLARDVGRKLAAAQEIDESTTTLDLRMEPGLVIVGRVEDVNGKPLSNAAVNVYIWSGNSGSQFDGKPLRTDAQGRFEVAGLPRGRRYSLDATAKGYGSANRNIQEDAETNRVEVEACVLKVAADKLAGEVVDAEDKPVARAHVYMYGEGQPQGSARTDEKGRFKFDAVCEGTINVSASIQNSHGSVRAQAGDTNVVIRLGANQSYSSRQSPKRTSLKGKPLPDLAAVELGGEAAPAGKPVLLCLFDIEQRPSRRFVKQLAEQQEALKERGVMVLGLQAAVTSGDSFKEWKDANPVTFPVGRVAEKADKTKWASEVESLPWLILTDTQRRVTAEGFALEELDAKLKSQSK